MTPLPKHAACYGRQCTAWQFCGDVPGGCLSSDTAFSLGRLACQLVHIPRSTPGYSEAPCLTDGCQAVAANRSVAGAPVLVLRAGALVALRIVGFLVLTPVQAC